MKDGGPAFPRPAVNDKMGWAGAQQGMTLRDYFMAHAPRGEILDMCPTDSKGCAALIGIPPEAYTVDHYPRLLAVLRGRWADAMLTERDK